MSFLHDGYALEASFTPLCFPHTFCQPCPELYVPPRAAQQVLGRCRGMPSESQALVHGEPRHRQCVQPCQPSCAVSLQASIKPKCGRMISFSSGGENPHGVKAVTKGQRCAVALWFTLDPLYRELVSPSILVGGELGHTQHPTGTRTILFSPVPVGQFSSPCTPTAALP